MSFLLKIPTQTTSGRSIAISPKPFSFKILVVGLILSLPIEEFKVTKWAKDIYGKSRPVQWRTTHNSEVNIDSPHELNGPDVFHVGYQTEGKKNIGNPLGC